MLFNSPSKCDDISGRKNRVANALRHLETFGTGWLWPSVMFNRSRRKRRPGRHCTYVHANSLHQRGGADRELHNSSEKKKKIGSEIIDDLAENNCR